jgi:endoglucanase
MISDESYAFLTRMLETASPSGFEERNAANVREYADAFADSIETTPMGSVIAAVNPAGSPRVMLAGHIDEIGLLIHYIDDAGYCYFRTIGGHDLVNNVGQRVLVHTRRGPVAGVIGKKPVHLIPADERGKKVELEDLWIDIGVTGGRDETLSAGVQVGDCATIDVGVTRLRGDRIAARAVDNRIGAWVVLEALRRVKSLAPRAAVFAVATVQEEIGIRGAGPAAFTVAPDVAIAVDVTFATDFPSMDKRKTSEIQLGKGPALLRGANANRKLADHILDIAQQQSIPLQIQATPGATGTDAGPIQIARGGIVTGLVEVPLRYMHTPCEVISLGDADALADLLAAVCASLTPEDDWIP